ncbi:MAG: 2-polyprenyl-3-methyl-6-methoxy-1,4-benzoquinone monooxygenase [Burkholderiales bacterium]|nr:2-polyprenyl-3-methyl-6-methoxy-1,4-benzoquinone monooxygenase [Burkholderiales bacterium]
MFRAPASFLDQLLGAADEALRTLSGAVTAARPSPAVDRGVPASSEDRKVSAGLMRVNHTGEICAQALYSGQALFARDARVRAALQEAATEERDHLAWCRGRLAELGSRPSLLDPLWYAGSFAWGVASGAAGDRWSLAFLAETEAQVERHLEGHLERLPGDDACSREIVEKMREDEARHGQAGRSLGAEDLPYPVKRAMQAASRVMTRTAYWV